MNLPLPAHQLTLNELVHYGSDSPLVARLVERIEELERELEDEKKARDDADNEHYAELRGMERQWDACETELARVEKMYDELEVRFLALQEEKRP